MNTRTASFLSGIFVFLALIALIASGLFVQNAALFGNSMMFKHFKPEMAATITIISPSDTLKLHNTRNCWIIGEVGSPRADSATVIEALDKIRSMKQGLLIPVPVAPPDSSIRVMVGNRSGEIIAAFSIANQKGLSDSCSISTPGSDARYSCSGGMWYIFARSRAAWHEKQAPGTL